MLFPPAVSQWHITADYAQGNEQDLAYE